MADLNPNFEELEDDIILTITLEDDSTLDCMVIATFPVGTKDYMALVPVEDIENEDGDLLLFRYEESEEEDEIELSNIDNDEELQAAYFAFNQIVDEFVEE